MMLMNREERIAVVVIIEVIEISQVRARDRAAELSAKDICEKGMRVRMKACRKVTRPAGKD